MITIPVQCIYNAQRYDSNKLEIVDTFTAEESIRLTDEGLWGTFRQENYEEIRLPQIAEPLYFRRPNIPIVTLGGKKYKVHFDFDHEELIVTKLALEETDEPATQSDCQPPKKFYRGNHYWKFFGQPDFIQNKIYPAGPDGKPCSHFFTVENGWGDCGNVNVLVSLGEDGLPTIAYFEASCC